MVTALITRPREDAVALAEALAARGLGVVSEPLLDIVPVTGAEMDVTGAQGVLATSANGVRALAARWSERALPVWAVGESSARVARELGYEQVKSAGGDVEDLARLVGERCRPEDGALLHAAGTVTAGDLAGRLAAGGFVVRRLVLYQARPATVLSSGLVGALETGRIQVALFFSPRTAATFATLAIEAGLASGLAGIAAYALSPAVARELADLPWSAVRVAEAPTQAALLAALDHDLERDTSMTESEQPAAAEPSSTTVSAPAAQAAPTAGAVEPPPHRERSGRWVALAVGTLLLGAIAAAVATFDEWSGTLLPPDAVSVSEPVAPNAPAGSPMTSAVQSKPAPTIAPNDIVQAELAVLRQRLAQVEARPVFDAAALELRLGRFEAGLQALAARPQVPETLAADLEALRQQLAELRRTSADAAAVVRLMDRVEKVESDLREVQARRSSAVAVLLAVGQLREAVARAMPYDAELRALQALAGDDADIAAGAQTLKPRAIIGIPALPTLIGRFGRMAPELVRAEALPQGQGWWRQTLDRLASLVLIRREDGAREGSDAAAIVARAEARLAEGDLEGAALEVGSLTGAAADWAAPWLADARARLAADKVVLDLTAHVIALVGARP